MQSVVNWVGGFILSLLLLLFCNAGISACNDANNRPARVYTVILSTGEVTRWVLPKGHKIGDTVHLTHRNGTPITGVINRED